MPVPSEAHFQGGDVDVGLVELDAPAQTIIDNVLWWTRILKTAHVTASEWLARSEPRGDADRRRGEQSAVKAEVDASQKSIQMVVSDTRAASAAGVSFGSRAVKLRVRGYRPGGGGALSEPPGSMGI
jgi:hypothetical protein